MEATTKLFTKRKIFDFVSFVITIFCLSFVIYKAQECVVKYLDKPESTDVSIEHASKHDYPAISICLNDMDSFYASTLQKCNLTVDDYMYNNVWVGSNVSHDFCQDPFKLFEEMTGNPFNSIINRISASDEEGSDVEFSYYTKDSKWNGRCFTFEEPQNTKVTELQFWFWNDAYVYVHSPGSYFGTDYKEFKVLVGDQVRVDVLHEVFEVLDFDGQACEKYPFGRDACIFEIIQKESMEQVGCTSPYGRNKSNICTNNEEKSAKAYWIFEDLTQNNLTDANERCPKSCTYQMTTFSSFLKEDYGDPDQGYLYLKFQRFIKVSRSRYAYTWLELLAEVGGYVGLFLGVSVNQTLSILKQIFSLFSSHKSKVLNI